jgi:PKD repeat protein
MSYGLDPEFRFHFSRAVYKGILKYMQSVHGREFMAQPLPVGSFSATFVGDNEVKLQWLPTADPLDSACIAKNYVIYTRVNNDGFDNGVLVSSTNYKQKIEKDRIYSFKITAVNEGGESFSSEILSVCRSSTNPDAVLIVNGFDRISAPCSFVNGELAGFRNEEDAGVPYISDIAFVGNQYEFRQSIPWISDDAPGFGASYADNEVKPVAGNTFDFPFLHGKSIQRAGYSFVSCSRDAVVAGFVKLNKYNYVDLILGKQKEILTGHLRQTPKYQSFPKEFRQAIEKYCAGGGNLFVSGAFVASDASTDENFLANTLTIKLVNAKASSAGKVHSDGTATAFFPKSNFDFYNAPNEKSYHAEAPDGIAPADAKGQTVFRYADSKLGAGVVYSGRHRACVLGFPFEIIKEESERDRLMEAVLQFFSPPINH